MIKSKAVIINRLGFHFRPADVFTDAMNRYVSNIQISTNGESINGKSINDIMAADIPHGAELEITCDGKDEAEAIAEAINLINTGCGETTAA